MNLIPALCTAAVATEVSWLGMMGALILLGHAIYPANIHNGIALCGTLIVGPIGGICVGLFLYKTLRPGKL